jgi:aromatic ring-cleaving dioxygenase
MTDRTSAPSQVPSQVNGYHAHVYYSAETKPAAERLAETMKNNFRVEFGGFYDGPVGPHPIANLQIIFAAAEFRNVVPWLMLNREGLDVLIHPLTDDSVEDHSRYALWLGTPVSLRLDTLRPTYQPELLPTA